MTLTIRSTGKFAAESDRTITIPLGFLGKGKYRTEIWQDDGDVSSVNKTEATQTSADSITLTLAPSGGGAVLLKK